MANKRRRDELSDSDSDEITPGKQILPVANLPHDFDQEPQDGMQYLFLVRRDARRLPHITRAKNPYEMLETIGTYAHRPSATDVLPCEEWRIAFQTHFSNLRKNLTQAVDHINDNSGRRVIPEKKDRDAWWKFLAGYPESTWRLKGKRALTGPAEANIAKPPDKGSREEFTYLPVTHIYESTNVESLSTDIPTSEEAQGVHMEKLFPPKVTPRHLREIDHRMSIHLLMYFAHWINVRLQNPNDPLTTISVGHGQWIFALLTKIEDDLSADEMSLLRNLARACLGLIQNHGGKQVKKNAVSQVESSHVSSESSIHMSDASCWMVLAAIAGHWGQRDLWADAEATLAGT